MSKYIVAACLAILLVALSYIIKFYLTLGYGISDNSAAWAELGEYFGGILGPILSFISLVLLIKSLGLQNQANASLREDLKNSEKTEAIRSFEALFFGVIESQKELFRSLKVEVGDAPPRLGVEAVLLIEKTIEDLRESESGAATESSPSARDFLEEVDSQDQIFGITRTFYIAVKLITDKLSDRRGFTNEDRKSHLLTLINFTDYAQLRLILICVQFMDFPSVAYLRGNEEFKQALDEVGLSLDLY